MPWATHPVIASPAGPAIPQAPLTLSLAQALLLVSQQWRQQKFDDAPRAGLDLDRDRHSGRQVDEAIVDLHLCLVKRYARRVEKLLTLRFAGVGERAGGRRG